MPLRVPFTPSGIISTSVNLTLPAFRLSFITPTGTVVFPKINGGTTQIGRTSNRTDGTAAGKASLTCDDTDRILDSDNTSSPLNGQLIPGPQATTTVVLDCAVPGYADYIPLYTGLVNQIDTSWQDNTLSQAMVSLVDSQRDLTAHVIAAGTVFPAQQTGARIGALLGAQARSGWGWLNRAPSARFALDTGQKKLAPLTCDGTTTTWQYVAAAAAAEEGLAFFDCGGIPTFQDQEHRPRQGAPKWVFGDGPGELPYEPSITMSLPNDRIVTDLAYQTGDGITSVFGPGGASTMTSGGTALPLADQFQGAARAQSEYRRFSVNRRDIPFVEIDAFADWPTVSAMSTSNRAWAGLNVQIGDLVTVNRRPGVGAPLSKNYFVDAIGHTIGEGSWKPKFYLVAQETAFVGFILGVSKLGVDKLSW